jgi:dephospho-CoA kinase
MLKVGLTGGIGAGKSTVAKILEVLGFPVFYSDQEAKKLMEHDDNIIEKLKNCFGSSIYINQQLNRSSLASKVFQNEVLLEKLNNIVHPAVRNAFDKWTMIQKKSIVINEAAILFETGAYQSFDKVILVTAPENIRMNRVMTRDNITKEQVIERMKNQWSDDKKIPLADHVIINDESTPVLPQIEKIIIALNNLAT